MENVKNEKLEKKLKTLNDVATEILWLQKDENMKKYGEDIKRYLPDILKKRFSEDLAEKSINGDITKVALDIIKGYIDVIIEYVNDKHDAYLRNQETGQNYGVAFYQCGYDGDAQQRYCAYFDSYGLYMF